MSTKLLDESHENTDVAEVVEKMNSDPLAFYDAKRKVRRIPIFQYNSVTGEPDAILRWVERGVIMPSDGISRSVLLQMCTDKGMDTYLPERGWIRNGRKAESNFEHERVK